MNNDSSMNPDAYPKILNDIKEKIEKGNIIFFLGAGFSAPLGYPTAQNLSESLCNKHKININYNLPETVDDLVKNKNIKKCDIVKFISELIKPDDDKIKNNPYKILRKIIDENKNQEKIYIFTTNWDDEIDKAFNGISYIMKNKKDYDNYENNLNNIINERVIIIKLHGDINNKDNNVDDLVITNDDVNKNKDNIKQLYNILSGEIWDKNILFIGYSLNDPEIDDIYKIMRGKSNKTDYFVTIDDKSNNNIETVNVIPGKNSLNFVLDLYNKITGKVYLKNIEFNFDNTIIERIKDNKHIIICGAKYTGKTMMSIRLSNNLENNNYNNFDFPDKYCDDDLIICKNSLDKNNTACIFLNHSYLDYFMDYFKKNHITLKNVEFLDYSVKKCDASKFYDEIINEYKQMNIYDMAILDFLTVNDHKEKIIEDSKYTDKIMDYSTSKGFVEGLSIWIHGGKTYETYIPAIIESDISYLIKEMSEQCINLNGDDKNKKIDEIYNIWSNKKERIDNFLGLSGLAFAETGIGLKDTKLMSVITGLTASILGSFTVTIPIALGIIFIGGYFGLKNWRDSKNENFLKNLYNAKEFWNELDDAKKRFIGYKIERLDKKIKPETVYYALENMLGKSVGEDDFNKFEKDVYEYVDKNGKEILDKINNELKKLESEIRDLDKRLNELQNNFNERLNNMECKIDLNEFGRVLSLDNFSVDIYKNVIIEDKKERPLIKDGLEDLKNDIIKDLRDNKKVLITGSKGSGKSTLAEWVMAEIINKMNNEWEKMYIFTPGDNIDDNDIANLMSYDCNIMIYYDPSNVRLYNSINKKASKLKIDLNKIPSITDNIERINDIKPLPTFLVLSEGDQVKIEGNQPNVIGYGNLKDYNIINMDDIANDIKGKINKNIYISITNDDTCWDSIKDKVELSIQAKLLGDVFNSLKVDNKCNKLKEISNNSIYTGYVIYSLIGLAADGKKENTYRIRRWFLPAYLHREIGYDKLSEELLYSVNEIFFNVDDVNKQYYDIISAKQHDLIENAINEVIDGGNKCR